MRRTTVPLNHVHIRQHLDHHRADRGGGPRVTPEMEGAHRLPSSLGAVGVRGSGVATYRAFFEYVDLVTGDYTSPDRESCMGSGESTGRGASNLTLTQLERSRAVTDLYDCSLGERGSSGKGHRTTVDILHGP